MTFIHTIPPEQADGEVHKMYQRQRAHFGYLPNYARAFSHRPEVMASWAALQATIRRRVSPRRFELVTLAAARALGSSYCALAHGKALAELLGMEATLAVVAGEEGVLNEAERAIMVFATRVARHAPEVSAEEIATLRGHGLGDEEIFDIVTVVAARAFFTRLLDGLGVEADAAYRELASPLREALTVGRPIAAGDEPQGLPSAQSAAEQ